MLSKIVRPSPPQTTRLPWPTRLTRLVCLIGSVLVLGVAMPTVVAAQIDNPVLFVTQVPIPADFATIGSTFANHVPRMQRVGRGGDLMIRYPDGTVRNLTREAGYGVAATHQGPDAIAVRDPAVDWSGTKAVFSMVVGAPAQQYQQIDVRWQLYEVTGLGQAQTAAIVKVPNQPESYNNISPAYLPDGTIVFTSDRPRGGEAHLYPQHDEYESTPTVSGLWRLDPASGDLALFDHAPSGVFTPTVDSFGRIIFTRWDHLQRDQQADADALDQQSGGDGIYGTFDYADESAGAALLPRAEEVFPEPRPSRTDLLAGTNLEGHRFNHFFPWQLEADGSALETLIHIGRHELHTYFNRSMNDDPNLEEFIASVSGRVNPNAILNTFQIEEDPTDVGTYVAIDAPEFGTHASGQVVRIARASPGDNPDLTTVTLVTHPDTGTTVGDGDTPSPDHSGHYRDPLPLSNGEVIVAHATETRRAANDGTRANPVPRYDFRLRALTDSGNGYLEAGMALTGGITRTISYWDPDVLVTYSGPLWELSPTEVRPRPVPSVTSPSLEAPEAQILVEEGVDEADLRAILAARGAALIVSRDVTTRDVADRQQPFNLRVPGGTSSIATGGTVYDVSHLQIFQGDLLRGIGGIDNPRDGRRVLARPLHGIENPPSGGGPEGSVAVAPDGSMAALVPARRALTWQLTAPDHTPVVRERYWLTFQPGEIRVCASCHGLNTEDQMGAGPPQQPPEALRTLVRFLLTPLFSDGFESGDTSAWSNGGR